MGLTQKLGTIPLAIFTDASNNIGIGGSPSGSYKFEVTGTGRFTGSVFGDVGFRTKSLNGYLLKNDADSANLGGLVRRSYWAGGAALDTQIFAETGYGIFLNVNGSSSTGMVINSTGNVGIGTTNPTDRLTVSGRLNLQGLNQNSIWFNQNAGGTSTGFIVGRSINSDDSQNFFFYDVAAAAFRMSITSGGDVVVGGTTTSGLQRSVTTNASSNSGFVMQVAGSNKGYLYVNGNNTYLETTNSGLLYCWVNGANGVYLSAGSTSWTSNSDERLKNITGNIENAIESLLTLRTVKHTWKSDENKIERLGLIAQDVEKVFPQVIEKYQIPSGREQEQTDKTEYLGVKYTELIPVLVKAIQELSAKVSALENKS